MITKFTFYKNYYEIIKFLPDKDKLTLYNAILEYMFEDKEPELKNLLQGIWVNIKMPLDTNKRNAKNGQNGGRPAKSLDNPKETQTITQDKPNKEPKTKANNISYFLFLINNNSNTYINIYNNSIIIEKIKEWLTYKYQKKTKYTEIGLQKLINKIEKCLEDYGIEKVIEVIDYSMSNNYQGIVFDRLQEKNGGTPDWFNKKNEKSKVSKEEEQELNEMLKEFK